MYVAFLGTGNALPGIDRANTSFVMLAKSDAQAVLVDCGGDPYRELLRLGLSASRIQSMIITHAHIDHIGGLPSLIESFRIAGRTTMLPIYGIPQVIQVIRDLLAVYAYELTMDHWPFSVELHEWQAGEHVTIGDFAIDVMPTEHSIPSIGMRITPAGVANPPLFAYTSDTMMTPILHDIAQNATFFVSECTYLQQHEAAARQVRHMTAYQAGSVAKQGHAQTLGLVHLSVPYRTERTVFNEAAKSFGGQVILPRDGTIVEVTRQRVRTIRRLPR